MAYNERYDVLYLERFIAAPEGFALYKPVSAKKLKPGMCGYFDHNGDWQIIVDLENPDEVVRDGWKPAGTVKVSPDPGKDIWGAMVSECIVKFPIKVDVQVNVPNTPARVGFKVGYDHKEDTGGILVTKGEVMHHQIDPLSSTKAKNWFITNAEMILQRYETTKKKGIFVVTKTYTAKERAVALLMSKEISVSFGVDVDLASIGKIAPEVGWWRSQKEEVWKLHQNDDGVVVFMSGWYWRPKLLRKKIKPTEEKPKQKKFLGEGNKYGTLEYQFSPDDENLEIVTLIPEKLGEFDEE